MKERTNTQSITGIDFRLMNAAASQRKDLERFDTAHTKNSRVTDLEFVLTAGLVIGGCFAALSGANEIFSPMTAVFAEAAAFSFGGLLGIRGKQKQFQKTKMKLVGWNYARDYFFGFGSDLKELKAIVLDGKAEARQKLTDLKNDRLCLLPLDIEDKMENGEALTEVEKVCRRHVSQRHHHYVSLYQRIANRAFRNSIGRVLIRARNDLCKALETEHADMLNFQFKGVPPKFLSIDPTIHSEYALGVMKNFGVDGPCEGLPIKEAVKKLHRIERILQKHM